MTPSSYRSFTQMVTLIWFPVLHSWRTNCFLEDFQSWTSLDAYCCSLRPAKVKFLKACGLGWGKNIKQRKLAVVSSAARTRTK